MPVIIQNIAPDFLTFWRRAQDHPLPEQQRLWHDLYQSRHPDVFAVCQNYGGCLDRDDRLAQALARYPALLPTLEPFMGQVPDLVRQTEAATGTVFGASPGDLPYVLMVGLFKSNAWADLLRGQQTAFLALEQFATR